MNDPVKENHAAFEAAREKLEADHMNRTALFHLGEVAGIYNDCGDAYQVGCDNYGLGEFAIQVIGARPIYLGIHTLYVQS